MYGQAIGDAMGAPVEGWPASRIAERFSDVVEFLPSTHGGDPESGKGGGRITDDTLMVEALIRAYAASGDHLDAYGFEEFFIPEIVRRPVWVPEFGREMPIMDRLWWPEKYPCVRLSINNAEPRSAGIGNCVNCGVAMYMMPVGAVNAGDPAGAYQEAAALALAHNESFAIEAGAVMAAACAAAFGRDASISSVMETASRLARDGTRSAIKDTVAAADQSDDLGCFIQKTRAAVSPYDQRTGHTADDAPLIASQLSDTGRPSRTAAIEELPVALAALKYGAGDFLKTIRAAVFYGRDCDSIAGMAGALWGAIYGVCGISQNLRSASDSANRRDFGKLAADFHSVILKILENDAKRLRDRENACR